MRKRIVIIAGVAIAVLFTGWLVDNRHGAALDVDGSWELHVPVAGKDVDAYFMGPGLKNDSPTSIELVRIEPVSISDGLELVEARIYRRDDFLAGLPASWSIGGGDLYDPTKIASVPLRGFELGGHQVLGGERAMMLRFRVSSERRPLIATDLRVTYRHGFRNHSQIVRVEYGAIRPVQATN